MTRPENTRKATDARRGLTPVEALQVMTPTGPIKTRTSPHGKSAMQKLLDKDRRRKERQSVRRQTKSAADTIDHDDVDIKAHPASRSGFLLSHF